ncbi:dihydroneopterin aldolase domain protein [Aspergillus terreus]|uniref:Dihydroneopterin aldolase domain protein n=1 Tax=Aspergillus terreus TaxID=33178 RepID=A0A5M3Z3Z9_ASPTE|nr:hypothetical protein ATETN484_0009001200 [Aspergillus terreus]GFF17463.1 dihydroneopterin aldolase domain protein [Aspergillus terreus]
MRESTVACGRRLTKVPPPFSSSFYPPLLHSQSLSFSKRQHPWETATPQIPVAPRPSLVDVVELRQVEFALPGADEAWHRQGKAQTCRLDLRLFFSSIAALAASDDVGLTLDYGRLYRQLKANIEHAQDPQSAVSSPARLLQGVDSTSLHS